MFKHGFSIYLGLIGEDDSYGFDRTYHKKYIVLCEVLSRSGIRKLQPGSIKPKVAMSQSEIG